MSQIEIIIHDASTKIKDILLEEANKFEEFPRILIGVQDPKYANYGKIISFSKGIAKSKPGIIIHDENKFWDQNHYVIMLPDGLYQFNVSMFANPLITQLVQSYPDWASRKEVPVNYIVHGTKALYEMERLLDLEKREISSR